MSVSETLGLYVDSGMELGGPQVREILNELDRNQDTISQLRAERDALARERDQLKTGLKEAGKQLIKAASEFLIKANERDDLKAKLAQVEADAAAMREAFDSRTGPYVLAFAVEMEKKLALNRHKGGRNGCVNDDSLDLLARLKEETKELQDVLDNMANGVTGEAADVANFSMMIADHCEGLRPFKIPGSGQRLLDELAQWKKRATDTQSCNERIYDELESLRATAQRRLELLKRCQWAEVFDSSRRCPMCLGFQCYGHEADCPLAAELKESK